MATILVYGIVNSVILALTAIGFSLTYGVSRIANFAHGAIYVVAGFTIWGLLTAARLPYPVAIALAVAITAGMGALFYRVVLARVRGMPFAEIIVTFAIGTAALESLRYFGFLGSSYGLPAWGQRTYEIAGVPIDQHRLLIVGAGVVLMGLLYAFTHHTRLGLGLRVVAQDEEAALTVGIDAEAAATASVALGAGLAAVAAALVLPLSFLAVESGSTVLIYAIAVCILGGLESTAGVIVASLIIGFAQIISVTLFGPHLQMIVALLAILVTLIVRPSGLFGAQQMLDERV